MKVAFIKCPGGVLTPATETEQERMKRFKNGEVFEVDIRNQRNGKFHRKVFAFMSFCFEHWDGGHEHQDEAKQFDVFRDNLTVLAGYYDSFYAIDGSVRVEAKSISYANMEQEEFEKYYSALINTALKHIFKTTSEQAFNRLLSFF